MSKTSSAAELFGQRLTAFELFRAFTSASGVPEFETMKETRRRHFQAQTTRILAEAFKSLSRLDEVSAGSARNSHGYHR